SKFALHFHPEKIRASRTSPARDRGERAGAGVGPEDILHRSLIPRHASEAATSRAFGVQGAYSCVDGLSPKCFVRIFQHPKSVAVLPSGSLTAAITCT